MKVRSDEAIGLQHAERQQTGEQCQKCKNPIFEDIITKKNSIHCFFSVYFMLDAMRLNIKKAIKNHNQKTTL